jgi:hypothetical protein
MNAPILDPLAWDDVVVWLCDEKNVTRLLADWQRVRMMNLATKAVKDFPRLDVSALEYPALGSGWIAYTYWNNGTGNSITSFETTWEVPPPPASDSGQLIYLFNGIQNYGSNYGILQPVLQWGTSPAGGGPYWAVASWYVTSLGGVNPFRVRASGKHFILHAERPDV